MSASGTFSVADSVEVAVLERSGFVESRHAGAAIVLAAGGEVVRTLGDVSTPIFPRSSLKPFQAVAVMSSGVTLRGVDAAIATASHTGTPQHVSLVRGLLQRERLTSNDLGCPSAMPSDRSARDDLVRAGSGPDRVYMNCSGKHAAMLLACRANDWSLEGYLDPSHPLQRRILDVLERFTGERPSASGVDGCGAPVHALSLTGLARGIHRVATSATGSPFALYREAGYLVEAARENGWAIGGPREPDSVSIARLGVFAKIGAEGIMVMTAPDGTTVALKTLDGSSRVSAPVALRLLVSAGALEASAVEQVEQELDLDVLGGGSVVGRLRATI